MDLSLCMIARDEEPRIRECLETIRPWVDEMVVVDTGSKDRTREIAYACGARVFEFPWCDDFAAARNASLAKARGRNLFWMDADDIFPGQFGPELKRMGAGKDPVAYGIAVQIPPRAGQFSPQVVDHVK